MASREMAPREVPLSEFLMQDREPIVDLTSPLNSVDNSSRDMMVVQEELEKRLKHRSGRQDLVERNILPPLSFPTAPKLFTNTQQLQRAQIADNLQKRMRNRPARDNLMQMNILPDLQLHIDPALQATQLQLRKSKLADALNDKLANRPGPLQLLQDGIIEPQLSEVVKGYELEQTIPATTGPGLKEIPGTSDGDQVGKFASIPEISLYSGDVFNTQHPPLQQRHSIAGMSPSSADVFGMDVSPGPVESMISFAEDARKYSESSISPAPSPVGNYAYEEAKSPEKSPRTTYPPLLRTSTSSGMLSGVNKSSSPSVGRRKNQKKYRKLRYHEYVPPSKSTPKGGKTNPKPPSKSDSPYSSLLQQQQLFLQLQVLQQQYPNGVLMQKLPDMISSLSKEQKTLAIAAVKGRLSVTSPTDLPLSKQISIPQVLPVEFPNRHNTSSIRFDELKVNDLKSACKELGTIVSGKKAELVERLMDQNKGVLPAVALPDNLPKESRRQVYSQGQNSSVDSQFSSSSVLSPGSPTNISPVFKFPSERGSHDGSGTGANKLPNLVQLPEVLPAANLHKEINELIERQKRNYICQRGMSEKSIAPRPELAELLAIKLPSYTTSNGRQNDPRNQVMVTDKSSRSLPASPKSSPANTPGYDYSGGMEKDTSRMPSLKSFPSATSASDTGMNHEHGLSSIPASGHGDVPLNRSSPVSGAMHSVSVGVSTLATSYYQQQQPISSLATEKQAGMRPGRTSVPAQNQSHGVHPMEPPSYHSVMRSRSIVGSHPNPNLLAMDVMHNGVSFVHDLTGMATPPNEMPGGGKAMTPDLFVTDSVEVDMDTGENSISDIFDILRAEGEEFSHAQQPASLPVLSGNHTHHSRRAPTSLPQTPQYGGGVGAKSSLPQDPSHSSHYMHLGNIMPFGNPSLTSQNKSGSDVCLNLMDGREGQKNSTGSSGLYNANVVLGSELNWLDLDNTSGLGLSPTLPGSTFGNLSSHSNPGSLPHDQFQNSFMEDGTAHSGMMEGMVDKSSNPAMNGYGGMGATHGGGIQSFLDSSVMQHHHGLYPTEEERLLELGLSTS